MKTKEITITINTVDWEIGVNGRIRLDGIIQKHADGSAESLLSLQDQIEGVLNAASWALGEILDQNPTDDVSAEVHLLNIQGAILNALLVSTTAESVSRLEKAASRS